MTMRVSEETKNKLESVKRLYNLDSLDSAVDYILEHPNVIQSKFYQYMGDLCGKYATSEDHVLYEENDISYIARLFTEKYRYSIVGRKDGSYLGCTNSLRASLPGEDWIRGNDLADGIFSKETVERIKSDIISCELREISNYLRNPPDDDAPVEVDEAESSEFVHKGEEEDVLP